MVLFKSAGRRVLPPSSELCQAVGALVGSAHSLASTTVFRSKPLPSGASEALPSRANNTRRDRIRSAGVLICLAIVPLMFAASRQGTDSRKFLGRTPTDMTLQSIYMSTICLRVANYFPNNERDITCPLRNSPPRIMLRPKTRPTTSPRPRRKPISRPHSLTKRRPKSRPRPSRRNRSGGGLALFRHPQLDGKAA